MTQQNSSSTEPISVAQVESAAIVAGFSFFTTLSGFLGESVIGSPISLHNMLIVASCAFGVAFFTKLIAFSKA